MIYSKHSKSALKRSQFAPNWIISHIAMIWRILVLPTMVPLWEIVNWATTPHHRLPRGPSGGCANIPHTGGWLANEGSDWCKFVSKNYLWRNLLWFSGRRKLNEKSYSLLKLPSAIVVELSSRQFMVYCWMSVVVFHPSTHSCCVYIAWVHSITFQL